MAKLIDWLKTTTVRVFDPNREQRLADLAEQVWQQIVKERRAFRFGEFLALLDTDPGDVPAVAERVYENACAKAWRAQFTHRERDSLGTIATLVGLSPAQTAELQRRTGLKVIEQSLGHLAGTGRLDDTEVRRINQVAMGLGCTTRQLVLHCFANQSASLLQSLFAGAVQRAAFGPEDWKRLVAAIGSLGLTAAELQQAIQPQAQAYVEHVLANAKMDGQVTEDEQRILRWLMYTFNLPGAFRIYVEREIETVNLYFNIRSGRLPSVRAPHLMLQAGELVHYCGSGSYTQVKQLKGGPRYDRHDGEIAITDYRLLFSSPTRTVELNHRRVVRIIPQRGCVELRCSGKGGGFYAFSANADLAQLIYEVAVGKVNQTIVEARSAVDTRHIPRDVRQRVWQRFGGRCAECGSTQYLEFDHIVPHSKGGSNSDANVQLLCRACNLKKSDNI